MTKNNSDYKEAIELFNNKFSHEELIFLLKEGNTIQRQFAALNLDKIYSTNDAEIFISNLVGVDGKIREVVALKLEQFTFETPNLFHNKNIYKKFTEATIDIDGNVCRFAINSANNIINDINFANYYSNELLKIIITALDEISKFTFRDKKYKINKQIFKIYWCLEGLMKFYPYADEIVLNSVIKQCAELQEYTIREKCAKLIIEIGNNDELSDIKSKLMHDENYYVRQIFK